MFKFISTIFYVIFIAMIVSVAGLLLGSMLPIPGNVEVKIVKSGSMEPAIPTGSIVVVKPVASYRFNDVITFGPDTKTQVPTTHRIIGVHGEGAATTYTTKGDANEEADEEIVQRRDIIGKVVFSLPYAGFVLDFARQPIGFILLIAVPAALVILEEAFTIFREARKWWKNDKGGGTPLSHDDASVIPRRAGDNTLDLRGSSRIIYSRVYLMDEILVPMIEEVQHNFAERMQARPTVPRMDSYGVSVALVLCLVFTSSIFAGVSGGTISYFQDIERSVANVLQAGTWGDEPLAIEEEQRSFAAFSTEEEVPEGEVLGESDTTEDAPIVPPTEPEGGGSPTEQPTEEPTETTEESTPTETESSPAEPESAETPSEPPLAEPASIESPPAEAPPAETPAPDPAPTE